MIEMKEIKKTKAGLVPVDWEIRKIEDISKNIFAGATPSTRKPEYWDGDIPWMSSGEINKKLIWNTEKKITAEGFNSSSTKIVPKDSVLIALAGQGKTRGKVAVNKIKLCTNQSLAAIVPKESTDPMFLYYNLDNRYEELRKLSTGDGGRGGLNLNIIKKIYIGLPSKIEQQKIAEILSTWDKAIELKEKLIEQKKELKKGLMQKLLTGEIRLPGFNGEWKNEKIKRLCKVYRGASPRPISDPKWFDEKSKIGWVRISDVSKSKKILTETEQYLSNEGIKKSRLIEKDKIIMSICATVGKPILTGFPVCIHDGIVVFENLTINKEYFYYALLRKENHWSKFGQTGSQINLNTDIVGNEKIGFPQDENEQEGIANVLLKADKEIELIESELKLLKQQKKGLMQLLLTGKIRVKV